MRAPASATVLVTTSAAEMPPWASALGGVAKVVLNADDRAAAPALREADCALVDGARDDPLRIARRLRSLEPTLQVCIVTQGSARRDLERSLLFTPGLGELWLVEPDEVDAALIGRAAQVTHQRRRYRATRDRIDRSLPTGRSQRPMRTLISDAYLASLLVAAPDPIVSVDSEGRILTWNPAAERVLGYAEREVRGRPLTALLPPPEAAAVARTLAVAGEQPTRIEVRFVDREGHDGVAELIATRLAVAGEEVRVVILHDLTSERRSQRALEAQSEELVQLNAELRDRSRQLESALTSRSRFYASMSHELRTPINAIVGYMQLLREGIYGELTERQIDGLTRAQRAARHLLELVNDVLDLAKIEAGRIDVQSEPVSFPALVTDLFDTIGPLAEEHGSPLSLDGGMRERQIHTDPRRVRQILLNLLSNAVKYGGGQAIRVRVEPLDDGGVRVDVIDRGRGIGARDLERIFDEFVQLGDKPATGTGLGLAISVRLARLLGGTLSATSEIGRGSTFTLTLPASLPQSPPLV